MLILVPLQAEILEDFQMAYAQKSWAEERSSWNVVILFNLVRNVNTVVDVLNEETACSISTRQRSGLTEWHRSILFRLSPLRSIEKDLKAFLGTGASEVVTEYPSWSNTTVQTLSEATSTQGLPLGKAGNVMEFCVWSSSGWKSILDQVRARSQGKEAQVPRVVRTVLNSCKDDMQKLWTDPITQSLLHSRYGRLEESPGLYVPWQKSFALNSSTTQFLR